MPSLFRLTAAFGEPLPELLASLLRFQARDPNPYNEGFELAEVDVRDLLPDPRPRDGRRLLPFGVNGHGSAFALWNAPGQPVEDSPVVFIDADGEHDRVIARNVREFLRLLTLDQEDPNRMRDLGSWRALMAERGWSHSPRYDELVRWLGEEHGIEPLSDPRRVLARAEEAWPDFRRWMGHTDPIEESADKAERGPPAPTGAARAPSPTAALRPPPLPDVDALLARGLRAEPRRVAEAAEQIVRAGRDDLLKRLLDAGLHPDTRVLRENTLLLHAALHGRRGCFRLLLAAGADPDAVNDLGEDAELLALDNDAAVAHELIAMLAAARERRRGPPSQASGPPTDESMRCSMTPEANHERR